jgi:ketosteroid isomerase-like protein
VRRGYDAFNTGNVEGTLALVHPDIEWNTYLVPGPGGGTYRGFEGVRELWNDVRNIFIDYRNDPEELMEIGDKVVAFICISGRGSLSGAEVEARIAHVFTFRDGKIIRVDSHEDRDEAMRAARGGE